MPFAFASTMGQSAAACMSVRSDCALKFGSLNPSRYFEPAGMVAFNEPLPQIMGSSSMPVLPLEPWFDQLYHQTIPGEEAVGTNAADGAMFDAMPRLHRAPPSSTGVEESTIDPSETLASPPPPPPPL